MKKKYLVFIALIVLLLCTATVLLRADEKTVTAPSSGEQKVAKMVSCPLVSSVTADLESSAQAAQQTCEQALPRIIDYLGPTVEPGPYKIMFDNTQYAAYVQSNVIHVSSSFAKQYPQSIQDTVAHELTHLTQNYSAGSPSWATEGIADFMRHKLGYKWDFLNCKPTERWTSGYGCTASFLTYASNTYDEQLVADIHQALKAGTYSDEIFIKKTGKSAETLYTECLQVECRGGGR